MNDDEEITPFRSSVRPLIQEALVAIDVALQGTLPSAKTRELRMKAESFTRILATWDAHRPTGLQLETLHDLVTALHKKTIQTVADASGDTIAPRDGERSVSSPKKRQRDP